MTVPKILLLTGTAPGDGFACQILLRDLCRVYPREQIACFWLENYKYPVSDEFRWMQMYIHHNPLNERHLHPHLRLMHYGALPAAVRVQYARAIDDRKLLSMAIAAGKEQRADLVWAILDIPTTIHLAKPLAEALNVPLLTTVWDPPEVQQRWVGRLMHPSVLDDFAQAVRHSKRCAVISENMQEEYQQKYHTESIVMRHGIERTLWQEVACKFTSAQRFTIGFSGTIYAKKEWLALINALDSVNWHIAGKDIFLRVLTKDLAMSVAGRANIEFYGWRSVQESIQLLSDVDINYIPYWFDEAYRVATRLCFPTKLSTYLATGRPILFHGPEGSSPTRFLQKYPAGISCHSLKNLAIIETIVKVMESESSYKMMCCAGQQALREEFDLSVYTSRFAQFIEISTEAFSATMN